MADPIDGHHQPTWNFKVIIKVVEKNRFHLILVHIFIIIVFRWTHRSFRTATLKPKILTSLYSSYSPEVGEILEILVLEYDFDGTRTRTRTREVSTRTRTRTRE